MSRLTGTSRSPSQNPFPGLRSFRADEDYLFFGREEQTMELLGRLANNRFVAVVGTSGSGKSSLVRCGLLSELLGGKMLDAGASWHVAVAHPGGNPLGLLTEALLEAELYDHRQENAREQLLATLSRSHFGLVEAVKQAGLEPDTNFLLVVDQFEEIFRFHEAGQVQQEAANEFVSMLLEAASQKEVPIYVVLTMRSDFIGECGQFEGLAEMVNRGEYLIPRLSREQYKRIVEGPIKVAGGQIAPRLLQRLLNDIGQQQDQLPCLQHALMRTWAVWSETGDSEALDLDDYQRIGKMTHALSLHADEIYDSLADDRQRQLCRGMFQALTVQESENRGIRRPQRLSGLCQILEVGHDQLTPIIDAFRRPGVTFLMPSAEVELTEATIIDISHESLMRVWTRLRHWVDEEAQAAGIYRRLSESAALYREKKAGLYRDPELGIALAWRESQRPNRAWAERYQPGFGEAMAFLEASRQAAEEEEQAREAARQHELEQAQQLAEVQKQRLEQQQRAARRLRATIAALALVAILAVVACVSALRARANAKWHAEIANLQATAARENGQRAGEALIATEQALAEVEREKRNAEQNLRKAEAAEAVARRAEDESRRLLYTTDMKLAPFVWKDEGATAEQLDALLARHDPGNRPGESTDNKEDLRGFEWYYYRHLIEDAAHVFRGDDVPVVDSAVTASGQLLTLDERWQLRRWDLETRAEDEAARLDLGQGRNVQTAALSPDGRLAALAGEKKVQLLNTATDEVLSSVDSADVGIRRLAFSADGGWLVIVDNRLRWCDTKNGRQVAELNHTFNRCEAIAVSPDGLTLVVAGHSGSGTMFSAFRLDPAGKRITPLAKDRGLGGTVTAAAVSPDGTLVAVGSKLSGAVILCDTSTGNLAGYKTSAHASHMAKVAFSPDGTQLATSDVQGTIKVWDNPRKLDLKSTAKVSLKGHSGAITKLYFLPDGKRLASTSADKTARIWDSQQGGAAIRPLFSSSATWGRYSPDGLLIASAGDGLLRLWDATTGHLVRQVRFGESRQVASVAFSPDNRLVAVGHGGSKAASYVTLVEVDSGKQLARLPGAVDLPEIPATEDYGSVTALTFSPDGKYLVAGFGSQRYISESRAAWPIKVWEVSGRRLVRRLEGCLGLCTSIDFSRSGALLAAGSKGGTATVWSTETWNAVRTVENPEQDPAVGYRVILDVELSPDDKTLAMASAGGSIMLWDVATGERTATLRGHASSVASVAFTPDGRTLASSSVDETVRLWNVDTRRELLKLDTGTIELRAAGLLAFSPDASRLLVGSYARTAFWSSSPPVWDNPDLAAESLRQLLASGVDFQSRVRMLSENLRLHEALERLASDDPRVQAALAATRANWHASQRRWPQATEEFDRLRRLWPEGLTGWLRTPGLVRVARALVGQGKLADAGSLLSGGAKRRIEDGAEVGLGADFSSADGVVRIGELLPGSPAAQSGLRPGDVVLKINGLNIPDDPLTWLSWRQLNDQIGRRIRFTVRHPPSDRLEEVVLTSRAFFAGSEEDSLAELSAAIDEQLATNPANAALLELRALVAGQHSDSQRQVASLTAAIDALSGQPPSSVTDDLKRLYRLRGDAYVATSDWPKAVSDYERGLADELTDGWALAEAETAFDRSIDTLIPTSEREGLKWRFTTEKPAEEWNRPAFDDSSWREGEAPFGPPGLLARTAWVSPEIWLRHTFEGAPSADAKTFFLRLWVDDSAEVFLNGKRLAGRDTWTQGYVFLPIQAISADALVAGTNTLAVYCRNTQGLGFFDGGLFAARTGTREVEKFFDAKAKDDPWLMLGFAYRTCDDRRGIDRLIERRPQVAGAVGDLFAAEEDWSRAVGIYDRGLAGETNVELFSKRADAYERLEQWDAAAADWRRAAEGNPDAGSLLAEFARRLAENGRSDLASGFYQQAQKLLEGDLRADPANVAAAEGLGKLLLDSNQASTWVVLKPIEARSELGATFSILADQSILAGGPNPIHDRYQVTLTLPADVDLAAVRLEALTHPSLPGNGPGRSPIGNFAQISWNVTATPPDGKQPVRIEFDDAWADHQLSTYPILPNGHWNIYGGHGGNCTAIWTTANRVSLAAGTTLSFEMQCQNSTDTGENLGHFRLALSSDRQAIRKQRALMNVTTGGPWARLAAALAVHGRLDEATRIAQRVLDEAATVAAKAGLLDAMARSEELLAALANSRPDDPDVELALARHLADRGALRLTERPVEGQRELVHAREIFTKLREQFPEPRWIVLKPIRMAAQAGATMTELDDGSLLAGGANRAKEVYEVEARLDGPLTAIRLQGLRHESLPGEGFGRGYDGHVMLTELEVEAASAAEPADWHPVKFAQAWTNDEEAAYPVGNAIDGAPSTPWGTSDKKQDSAAIFVATQPLAQAAGTRLRIRLRHEFGAQPQQFGRFRLSVTGASHVLPAVVLRQADADFRAALVALGRAYAQDGKTEESARAFAGALELAKDRAEKSEVVRSAAPLEGVLDKLAGRAPDDAELQAGLVRSYAARGESRLAAAARAKFIELYERSLKADQPETQSAEVAEALAGALVDSRRTQEWVDPAAFESEGQTLKVRQIGDPWMRLAAAYVLAGEIQRATKLLRARGKEPLAVRLEGGAEFDAIIDLLGADPELDRLAQQIARHPDAAAGYFERGRYFARLGRWRESADDFLRARNINRQDRYMWLAAAPSLILAGDEDGYRTLCREMVAQFRGTDVAMEADVLCKVCLLRPGTVNLADLPVKRLLEATRDDSQAQVRPYFWGCCALVSYRAGNSREAITWADKLTDPRGLPGALVLAVRALAEQQLGQTQQARQTLAKAGALIPTDLRTLGTSVYRGPIPVAEQTANHDWLIAEILRREASALVDSP